MRVISLIRMVFYSVKSQNENSGMFDNFGQGKPGKVSEFYPAESIDFLIIEYFNSFTLILD